VNKAILEGLVSCSVKLQEAYATARREGRLDLCQHIRDAQWDINAAIADLAPNKAPPEPS
jgi:hypothetical protein